MLLKLCFKNNYGWIFGALYQSINGTTQPPKQPKFRFGHGREIGRVKDCFFCLPEYFEETICDQQQSCGFCLEKICRHLRALSEVAKTQNNLKRHTNLNVIRTMAHEMQIVTAICDLDPVVCSQGHFPLSEERQNFIFNKGFCPSDITGSCFMAVSQLLMCAFPMISYPLCILGTGWAETPAQGDVTRTRANEPQGRQTGRQAKLPPGKIPSHTCSKIK